MRRLWLVTTAHLEEGLWFRDEEDFKVAMNFVAIQAHNGKVVVLAFILMSNHVHFVLRGSKEDVIEFMIAFKHRYSLCFRRKDGIKELLRENDVNLVEIPIEDEAPERAIAYVLMNCVAANICSHPSQYPWGTGNVFFNSAPVTGKNIGSFSMRALKRLLHSNCETLPVNWIVSTDGYILPQNYVDVKAVEACFRSPKRMNYFLMNSSKAKKRIDSEDHIPAFRDQTIIATLPDLCMSLFGHRSYADLLPEEQTELVRQIRYRFSANVNQIARVCGISYDEAARKMDAA